MMNNFHISHFRTWPHLSKWFKLTVFHGKLFRRNWPRTKSECSKGPIDSPEPCLIVIKTVSHCENANLLLPCFVIHHSSDICSHKSSCSCLNEIIQQNAFTEPKNSEKELHRNGGNPGYSVSLSSLLSLQSILLSFIIPLESQQLQSFALNLSRNFATIYPSQSNSDIKLLPNSFWCFKRSQLKERRGNALHNSLTPLPSVPPPLIFLCRSHPSITH